MKILHISDTHGVTPSLLKEGDVIVHSGDLMPNRTFGNRSVEETFQQFWVETNAKRLKSWIGTRPFVFCPGNHDFIDPTPILRNAGVDAHWLCDDTLTIDEVMFYGFPWTPTFYDWNWMCGPTELRRRLAPAVELLEQGAVDVFVAHGPMFGVLDRNDGGEHCGSALVRDAMQKVRHAPRLFLCGHIHESAGVQAWSRGITVSNAACRQNVLVI